MIHEIQKRPFVRLLFWWISGIFMQILFPLSKWFIAGVFLVLLTGCGLSVFLKNVRLYYDCRWVWGCCCVVLILTLSMGLTDYTQRRIPFNRDPGAIEVIAVHSRQRLIETIDRLSLSDTEKSVLAALTIGYKKTLPRETRSHFSFAGVSHILAVSGFHVAVVCGFLTFLFRIFPRYEFFHWLRFLLIMSLLWSFVLITGLAPSAVRAGLMLSFYLTGRVIRRTADRYNTLAAAAFCMLVYNPMYLFDIGFQLSYSAVFFILYLQPRLQYIIDVKNPLLAIPWGWITVTVSAQIGTTFLCLYYFGYFSWVFLFTNLPIMLFATVLIPAGLLWMLLPASFPGSAILQTGVEKVTGYLVGVVEKFGSMEGVAYRFSFDLFHLLAGYSVLFLLMIYILNRRSGVLFFALSLFLFLLVFRIVKQLI